MDDQFYTIEEVATLFKVTRKAIYDWMNDGKLEYVRVGSRRRITKEALLAFIKKEGGGPLSESKQEILELSPAA